MPGEYTYYGGSRLLTPFADFTGLRIDQINFVVAQFASLLIAVVYRQYCLKNSPSRLFRLITPLVTGIIMLLFCFGQSSKHILANLCFCYIVLRFSPLNIVHKLTFVVTMAYISFIHWHKVYYVQSYVVDITGPMMVLTQKMTSLACSLHDSTEPTTTLAPILKAEVVRKRPPLLEYLSYCISFQWVLAGPWFSYRDFIDFIDEKPYWKNNHVSSDLIMPDEVPDPKPAVIRKVSAALVAMFLAGWIQPMFPMEALVGSTQPIIIQLLIGTLSLFLVRCQYYFAWNLGEAVTNASGFGFSGIERKTGKAIWKNALAVNIYDFETSDNWRDTLEAWNCSAQSWLRRVAYERAPRRFRVLLTYVLSAWWHGFYPGYYMTFTTGILFTHVSRMFHNLVRPHVLGDKNKKIAYDCLTFCTTKLAVTYVSMPFIVLHYEPSLAIYTQIYFCGHFVGAGLLLLVPILFKLDKSKQDRNGVANNNNNSDVDTSMKKDS